MTDLLFNAEELEISDDPDNPDPNLGGWDVCRTAAECSTFIVTLIYTNQPPQITYLSPLKKIINNRWAIERFARDAVSNEKGKEEAVLLLQDSWEIARTGGAPYKLFAISYEDAVSYVDAQNVGLRWEDLSCEQIAKIQFLKFSEDGILAQSDVDNTQGICSLIRHPICEYGNTTTFRNLFSQLLPGIGVSLFTLFRHKMLLEGHETRPTLSQIEERLNIYRSVIGPHFRDGEQDCGEECECIYSQISFTRKDLLRKITRCLKYPILEITPTFAFQKFANEKPQYPFDQYGLLNGLLPFNWLAFKEIVKSRYLTSKDYKVTKEQMIIDFRQVSSKLKILTFKFSNDGEGMDQNAWKLFPKSKRGEKGGHMEAVIKFLQKHQAQSLWIAANVDGEIKTWETYNEWNLILEYIACKRSYEKQPIKSNVFINTDNNFTFYFEIPILGHEELIS